MATEEIYKLLQNTDENSAFGFQYNDKPYTGFPKNQNIPNNNVSAQPSIPNMNNNQNGNTLNNNQQFNVSENEKNLIVENLYKNIENIKKQMQVYIHDKLNNFMTQTNSTSKEDNYLRTTISQMFNQNQNQISVYMEEIFKNYSQISLYRTLDKTQNMIYSDICQEITDNIMNVILGYGPIEAFLHDKDVTEIICCTYDNIWIEKGGKMIKTNISFNSEKEFRSIIDSKILQPLGRRVDDAQPLVNARLADRSRVNVVINPISADGATLDIRKFREINFTIPDYIKEKSLTKEMGEFLKYTVKYKKNVIVSGGTGSGKTTLLNCLSAFIPENEAIVTIEDTLELQLVQPCIRRLEARAANAEGTGSVSIRDCLVNALRMRPDRIIVGECRSHEVVDMLQAMNTGHDGSLTTVHSNSPKDMIERLYTMYTLAGIGDVPEKAIKSQIASAIHIIVQVARLPDGHRKIVRISEVVGMGKIGMEDNNEYVKTKGLDSKFEIKNVSTTDIILQDIFKYDVINEKFVATGWIPTFWDYVMTKAANANTAIFKGGEL